MARTLAGRQATPETIALISHRLGLDQPIWKQYLDFLGKALHGNLGYDYYHQVPGRRTIIGAGAADHAVASSSAAPIIWLVLGVFNGVISAIRPRSFTDRALTVVRAVLLLDADVPARSAAALLPLLPAHPGRLPDASRAGGYVPLSDGLGPWVQHLILPWFTLALVSAATYTRLTRGSMLDVLGEDYIRTARSKGIRERRVVMPARAAQLR